MDLAVVSSAVRRCLNDQWLVKISKGNTAEVEAHIQLPDLVGNCHVVYRRRCQYHGGRPAVEVMRIWIQPNMRRRGLASCVLWEIQSWLVSNGNRVECIYVTKLNEAQSMGVRELLKKVARGGALVQGPCTIGFDIA